MNRILFFFIIAFFSFSLPFNFTLAQSNPGYQPLVSFPGVDEGQPIGLAAWLEAAFRALIGIAGVLAVVVIVIGGIQYVFAIVPSAKTEAKSKIVNALLGLLLALLAWLILQAINPQLLRVGLNVPELKIEGMNPGPGGPGGMGSQWCFTRLISGRERTICNATEEECNKNPLRIPSALCTIQPIQTWCYNDSNNKSVLFSGVNSQDTCFLAAESQTPPATCSTNCSTTPPSAACIPPKPFKESLEAGGTVCGSAFSCSMVTGFDSLITAASNKYNVPEKIIRSLIQRESSGITSAVSKAGACGLMQLLPSTAKLSCEELKIPEKNIDAGTKELKRLFDNIGTVYQGVTKWQMVFARYNCCANGDNPNSRSNDCNTSTGWPYDLPKWACPVNPGPGNDNMCAVRAYACRVGACE